MYWSGLNYRSKSPAQETAFQIMYELVDCAVGMKDDDNVRNEQEQFLTELTVRELAILGVCSRELVEASFSNLGNGPYRKYKFVSHYIVSPALF